MIIINPMEKLSAKQNEINYLMLQQIFIRRIVYLFIENLFLSAKICNEMDSRFQVSYKQKFSYINVRHSHCKCVEQLQVVHFHHVQMYTVHL